MNPTHFSKIPDALLQKVLDNTLTTEHYFLYGYLYSKANWKLEPPETNRLLVRKILEALPFKRRHFYQLLKDLIDKGFVERVYDEGKKRSRFLKVRLILEPDAPLDSVIPF